MPPHFLPTEATLDEVLFVLGEPLCEKEVWAILLGGSIALAKYFEKSANAHHIHYLLPAINPDTLLLDINGTVSFVTKKPDNAAEPRPVALLTFDDKTFVSPENLCNEIRTSKPKNGKIAIEKMFIYSLGKCMFTAVHHCTEEPLESLVSLDLQACLSIMIEESLVKRISADSLKKVCLQHIDLKQSYTKITKLAKEILGSVEMLSSSANLILPNPLDAIVNAKKSEKQKQTPPSWLNLPKPSDQSKKKGLYYDKKILDAKNLILPSKPTKDKFLLDEKPSKNLAPMHLKPVQALSALTMSKTNDSVDMTRAITSTPSKQSKQAKEVTMEFNGSMTATMITNEDSTLDALNEPSLDFLLYGKEREASIEDSFLYDTTDDLIIDEKTLSQTSNVRPSIHAMQKPPSNSASPARALNKTDSPLHSALASLPVSASASLSPITTPVDTSPLSDGKESDGSISPPNLPPVTPSPISPSLITQSQRSPTPISSDHDLNVTLQSPPDLSPSHETIPPPVKEINTMSAIEDISARDQSKGSPSKVADELPARMNNTLTSIEGIPDEERGSIEGRDSSHSPVQNDVNEAHKSMPNVSAPPIISPARVSSRGSILSGRRHSSGSYGTVMSGRSLTQSQASLTHGAYSLEKGLDMEPEYPMSRFKSGGALSLCRVSSSSLPRSLDGRGQLDLSLLGPEFVLVPSDPDKAFVDITPTRLGPLPKKMRLISVILLNAQEIQTQVQVSSKGKELFEQIATHIGLKETLYFGFALLQDGEYMFIDLDEKLTKHAPLGWKDESNKKKTGEFVLHLKVKFFIENPRALRHNLTSHFYYLHLRKTIATGYTHCSDDSLLLRLGGYALQAEYGDFCAEFDGVEYFRLEHYLPSYLVKRFNRNDLYINLATIHQTLSGKTSHEAEMAFLDEVKNVDEYGVLFHRVSRTKDNFGDSVLLGICINGILIKEHKRNQRKLVHQQTWDDIKKFYFEKKQFKLKPTRVEEGKIVFFTNHYRRSKYLFKMCQSFHRFHIFNQPVSTQTLKFKKENAQGMKSTFSDPLHNTVYSTLKGSEYSNYTFKSGEMKVSNGIKFVPKQNEEEYNERSVDVSATNSPSLPNNIQIAATLNDSTNVVQAQLERAVLPNQKDRILVNDVEIAYKAAAPRTSPRTSPRSLYSDEESLYTEDEISARNCVPVDIKRENMNNGSVPPRDERPGSDKSTNPEDVRSISDSTYSRPYSDYGGGGGGGGDMSNLKRMGGMMTLDGIRSPTDSACSRVESDGAASCQEMYASASEYYHEMNAGLKAAPPPLHPPPRYDRQSPCSSKSETVESFDICIEKKDGSYGFSITGGVDSDSPRGGIYIKSLLPQGAACMSGQLRIGDRVVAADGVSLENLTHSKAVEVLKQSTQSAVFSISRTSFSSKRARSRLHAKVQHLRRISSQDIVFDAEVEKDEGGLGLCLAGGKDSDLIYKDQIMVRKIHPGLPIARSGKFQVGDILIAINDQIVEGLSHQEALSTIRSSQRRVTIIAKRPTPDDIPEELFMNSRPVSPQELMRGICR